MQCREEATGRQNAMGEKIHVGDICNEFFFKNKLSAISHTDSEIV